MRLIDRMAIRSAKPVPADQLRDADPSEVREQRNAHYIALARMFADSGVDSVAALKASEKREYDRRIKAIRAIEALASPTDPIHRARLRLFQRSTNV